MGSPVPPFLQATVINKQTQQVQHVTSVIGRLPLNWIPLIVDTLHLCSLLCVFKSLTARIRFTESLWLLLRLAQP